MSAPSAAHQSLRITVGGVELEADLGMPDDPREAVLFAHGSGGGRRSPRNRFVSAEVNRAGLVTVLVDLLTPREAGPADRRDCDQPPADPRDAQRPALRAGARPHRRELDRRRRSQVTRTPRPEHPFRSTATPEKVTEHDRI
jgi:hypothetical protein